jgi:hypothetical protein
MKSDHRKSYLNNPIFLFFLMTAMSFSIGCASVTRIVEKTKSIELPFTSSKGLLRKKIGVAPLSDMTKAQDHRLSKELASLVMENLTSKCDHSIFVLSDHSLDTLFLANLPKNASGETDSLVLAQKARMAGLNAVVVMNIGGVASEKKKSGIIGFRKNRENVRIWVKLEVYDAYTGAKLLFDSLSVEIKPEENEAIDDENLSASQSVMDAMAPFSKTIGKSICKTLEDDPWRGFVISVENDKAVISSGLDAGVQVGDVFALYEVEKTIDNVSGQQFRMPGKMVDEIKITSVAANRSEGVSVSGREVRVDSVIQIKKD